MDILSNLAVAKKRSNVTNTLPVAMIVSPGASMAPGGRIKQLLGAVV